MHGAAKEVFTSINSLNADLANKHVRSTIFLSNNVKALGSKEIDHVICLQNINAMIQSHLYIRRGNRRLSLAALPGLPAASRGIKLPLLANTRSVF